MVDVEYDHERLDIGIVIPVHNAEATIREQLEALCAQQDAPEFECIVVCNRCTDDSASIAGEFKDRLNLRIVQADEKPSAAYALNAGASASTASLLLFCDADDRVGRSWVGSMADVLKTADFVGGKIVVDRTGLPDWAYERLYRGLEGSSLRTRDQRIRYPLSACLGIHHDVFDAVGGFDEAFAGAAGEEIDLAIRLFRSGFRVGVAPDADVIFRPRTSFRAIVRQQRAYATAFAELDRRERTGYAPPSAGQQVKRTVRTLGHQIVRKKNWRPSWLTAEALDKYFEYTATRHLAFPDERVAYDDDPDLLDFVAPIETPNIGGLGLLARGSVARWYGRAGVEVATLGVISRLLHEGDGFIDIGANVGTYTLCAAIAVGPTGHVIAFEPDPRTGAVLERNLERHHLADRCEVRGEAVGEMVSTISFVLYEHDVLSGGGPAAHVFRPGTEVNRIDVDCVPLDTVVEGSVSMIKVDVEGFELAVLRGAEGLLRRSPEAILVIEVNPAAQKSAGGSTTELFDYIASETTVSWLVEERSRGPAQARPLDAAALDFVLQADESWYANLIVVPAHRRDEVSEVIGALFQSSDADNE